MPRLALVVNEPPPYRIPVFNRLAALPDLDVQVIFCCRREPNRQWNLPRMEFNHVFLRERIRTVDGRYIHHNPDVLPALTRFDPQVVIGNGFNPTHGYAWLWTMLRRRAYVPMTDGTLDSEKHLSPLHHRVRHFVYRRAPAMIAASRGGLALYRSYGVDERRCHVSCLCVDNGRFRHHLQTVPKAWDFIVCGRLEPGKAPDFALQVAQRCARVLNRPTRLLFVGSGSLEAALKAQASDMASCVEVHFHGFARQEDLPALYQSARIFLFPTRADVWGVVANEACAAGLPVIVTPQAGVAGELIIDGKNGYVRALNIDDWTACALRLLQHPARCAAFGRHAELLVSTYHVDAAAHGIAEAVRAALRPLTPPRALAQAAVKRPA
ncbi:MAG: glycosyltransferase family 4 protein [Oxalobacteraceae bacterium]